MSPLSDATRKARGAPQRKESGNTMAKPRKKQLSIYLSQENNRWIENNPAGDTPSASANILFDWSVRQLRRGAFSAFQCLSQEERQVIIKSVSSLTLTQETPNLSARTEEWLTLDAGRTLEWPAGKKEKLIEKLTKLDATQTMGLICWARGFWVHGHKDIEVYSEDVAPVLSEAF